MGEASWENEVQVARDPRRNNAIELTSDGEL